MIEVGITGRQEQLVTEHNTAESMESGCLPIFATPMMIALAEKTAMLSVAPYLTDGEDTVGTAVNMRHLSPTPIGMKVWCETKLVEVDRRRLVFECNVYDDKGKIGEGTHERFIIRRDEFCKKAESKKG